jgi:hypothetical protein
LLAALRLSFNDYFLAAAAGTVLGVFAAERILAIVAEIVSH